MVKFIHKVIFSWIWICTWVEIAVTSLFILGGWGLGIIMLLNPSIGPYMPLHDFSILFLMVVWTLICLVIGFVSWIISTLNLIMLGYYTRPQAWPEHYGLTQGNNIEELPMQASQFNKAIYSR